MTLALILTAEKAAELGYTGDGPFTLGGAFPGEYLVDQPLEVAYLGFDSDEAAQTAFDEAFGDAEPLPLEWVDVASGDGLPIRENHALSELEVAGTIVDEAEAEAAAIRTHKDADRLGDELGITFPEGATVKEKAALIAEHRASTQPADGHVAGDPDEVEPAPGAEGTTPTPAAEVVEE